MLSGGLLVGLLGILSAGKVDHAAESIRQEVERTCREALAARGRPDAGAHFRRLAQTYETLRRRGIENADLERSLGNAYFCAGDVPQAILAYRRGLMLAPGDRGLNQALAFARAHVARDVPNPFGRPPDPLWPAGLPWPEGRGLHWVGMVLYGLAWILSAWWWTAGGRGRAVASAGAWGAALLVMACLVRQVLWSQRDRQEPPAVILQEGTLLRKGNGLAYPVAYVTPLPRGTEVRQRFVRGAWVQIELTGGEIGWVPQAALLTDGP